MRIKKLIIIIIIIFIVAINPLASEAGTFMVGAKGWYTTWEASILDWFEKDIAVNFMETGAALLADKDPGYGYLAGPLLGYQTDNGKWSISIAPMVFSSFSQDWTGSIGAMALKSDVRLERKDLDFAVNYSVSKYVKIFVGYKHQMIDMEFLLSYNTMMEGKEFKYDLESTVYIPTAGAGFFYPVHEKLVVGLQLGALYSIPDLKMTNYINEEFDIWPHPSIGFNGEASINYQPLQKLIVQLGFRYQKFILKVRSPGRWNKTESEDITHGVTLSALYLF